MDIMQRSMLAKSKKLIDIGEEELSKLWNVAQWFVLEARVEDQLTFTFVQHKLLVVSICVRKLVS